jgi:ABC-type phosphate transport system permease subunit
MEPTEAEKLKARRIQRLLYVLMALMIGIPTVVFILQTFR